MENEYKDISGSSIIFVVSYRHFEPQGKFKFSSDQWEKLKRFFEMLSIAGVKKIRLWLDQCLRMRDSNSTSWAHTGIFPYCIWPVISLGTKLQTNDDRTLESMDRYWLFLEEISALWGAGLIIMSERSTYNSRKKLNSENAMKLVLLNIFHGAAVDLDTEWNDDKIILKEIAKQYIFSGSSKLSVGPNWKIDPGFQNFDPLALVRKLCLADIDEIRDSSGYLDGSCEVSAQNKWGGIEEFFSGNQFVDPTMMQKPGFEQAFGFFKQTKVELDTRDNKKLELQQIRLCEAEPIRAKKSLWILVKSHGFPEISWRKVVHGKSSTHLSSVLKNPNRILLKFILAEQLQISEADIKNIRCYDPL